MKDDETLKVYAHKAQEYADLVDQALSADPLLQAFIAALPAGGSVLDLGCGPGQSAHVMADAGLLVTATDAVPEMVALAGKDSRITAKLASFDDITGTALYDGIWANFSLLHAPRAKMPGYLAALHSALQPAGLFHIALKTGTGEKRDPIGRLYTYYTDAELTQLLHTAGFTVLSRETGAAKGLDGVMANWIAIHAHA